MLKYVYNDNYHIMLLILNATISVNLLIYLHHQYKMVQCVDISGM